jgi:hypothetical protein
VRAPILVALLVLSAHASLPAQLDSRVKLGATVRLRGQPDAPRVTGKISSIDGDTLIVNVDNDTVLSRERFPLRDVTELSVYGRGKSAETMGMVFGTIGVLAGTAVYLHWCASNLEACRYVEEDDDPDDDPYDEEAEPLSLFSIVALGTGILGWSLGYALAPPVWEVVNLPLRIGIAPTRDGLAAFVSIPAPRFIGGRR